MATAGAKSFEQKVDAAATIQKLPFKIATNILFGFAILSVIGRIGLKIHHRRNFRPDDYIMFFGTAALITATGVLYSQFDNLYLGPALQADPSLILELDAEDINDLINNEIVSVDTFYPLLWTCIFSVKFSFLAFFKQMVDAMESLKIYYRATIVMTGLVWGFVVCTPFIICPYFKWDSVQCFQNPNTKLYVLLISLGTAFDILTDLMIVSIPILVLRRSNLKMRQKVAMGTFLSLSAVMIIIAIVRSSKIHGPPNVPIDVTWAIFWCHIEASTALSMVSLTAFRTIFNQRREERVRHERLRQPPRSWKVFASFRRRRVELFEEEDTALPQVPRATLTGLRTFIRGNNRTENSNATQSSQGISMKSYLKSTATSTSNRESLTALPQIHPDMENDPWVTRPPWT